MSAFYDYVRGITEQIPDGYQEQGMRLYRHLVLLGVRQLLEAHYPTLPQQLGQEQWHLLLQTFVRESRWESPIYGDLQHEFMDFLKRQTT
jgi:hypothetical protein